MKERRQDRVGSRDHMASAPDSGRRALLVLAPLLLLGLGACGGSPVATFSLSVPDGPVRRRRGRGQLVVTEPAATAPYDNERIVVRTGPGAVAYLSGAQWAESLPDLLQTQVIQTFENLGYFHAVGRPDGRLTAPVSLNLEIRRFDIDVQTSQAVVELSAKLIHDGTGRALAARIFSASVPASAANGEKATTALNLALDQLLSRLTRWTRARL